MNNIPDILSARKLTATAIAKLAGVATPTVTRALRGETIPGDTIAIAVEKATGGEITAEQFVSHCFNVRNPIPSEDAV